MKFIKIIHKNSVLRHKKALFTHYKEQSVNAVYGNNWCLF